MDKATRDALRDRIATEPLGAATFKGIAAPVEVFAAAARRA
jgi:class 3 adenylate cyclase